MGKVVFTVHRMPLYLEGRSGAVAGRRLTVTREKPFVIRTKTTNHQGEVQVCFSDGSYRLDNRSHMRCRIRGTDQHQAVLVDGDDLEIGNDRFVVVIQSDPADEGKADDQDTHDTQSLAPIVVDKPMALPQAITPAVGTPIIGEPESALQPRDHRVISSQSLPPVRDPSGDSTVEQLAPSATSESDRQRQTRRISASRLTAVEPAQREGLLSKVGKVFGRRDERHQRLAELEANRAALLAAAGRHALGAGGSLGLPEKAIATLLAGGTVTVSTADLSPADLERWRAQRQRMVLLDAEIAALRRALGMGSDPQMHQQSSPTLRPDQKAMQDRAFATLDGLSTDELSRADTQDDKGVEKSTQSGRMRPVVPRRRR